jgi:hypothetical protein
MGPADQTICNTAFVFFLDHMHAHSFALRMCMEPTFDSASDGRKTGKAIGVKRGLVLHCTGKSSGSFLGRKHPLTSLIQGFL